MNQIVKIDNVNLMCEQDVFALGQQFQHVKTYAPSVVKTQKQELIKIMLEMVDYLGDIE